MSENPDADRLDKVIDIVNRTAHENVALMFVCSSLLAEISSLSPNPHAKLAEVTSRLMGLAEGITRGADGPGAEAVTKMIEKISTLAESSFRPHSDPF